MGSRIQAILRRKGIEKCDKIVGYQKTEVWLLCDKKGSMLLRKWCDKLGEKTERKSKVGVWGVRGGKKWVALPG